MYRARTRALGFLVTLGALTPLGVLQSQLASASRPATPPDSAGSRTKAVKTLNLNDYGLWRRITQTGLSPNGAWTTFAYQPNDGDATLHVKQLEGGDKLYTIPIGSAPAAPGGGFGGGANAANASFSDDSRWVAYYVNPPGRSSRGGRPGGAGGRPSSPGPGAPNTPRDTTTPSAQPGRGAQGATQPRRLEILDLTTGEKLPLPNAASYKFSKGSKYLAVRLTKAVPTDTSKNGADLLLRDLATGTTRNIGNVNLYDFDDAGRFFAYTVDATEKLGNGVYVIDLASGETRQLDGKTADYDQLTWSDEGTSLAVLRGFKAKDNKQRDNVLLAWTNLGASKPQSAPNQAVEYDPTKDTTFPKGFVVSEFSAPRFSKDGARIFLGLKDQEPDPARSDEPQANVDIWHWKDADPQSVQIIRLAQERRATLPAVFHLGSKKLVQLGDSDMRTVATTPNGKWGIGRFDAPYRGEVAWGGSRADLYKVNTESGERTLIAKGLTRTMGTSPDSRWFLYLENKHVKAANLETGKILDLDDGEKLSFVDVDDDHPYEVPVYGVAGWAKDGKSVLLYHKYDVWQIPLADGAKAINLTAGAGDAGKIQFRIVRLDRNGGGRGGRGGGAFGFGGGTDDDEGIDLSKPLTLSGYGEWTKKTGYFRLTPGGKPEPLIWDDKQIGGVQKAEKADRVIFTEQTFREFPDVWTSSTSFAAPKKITDANPQLGEYAWGSKVLIDYTNSKGQKLQGTLTLPANYEPGKKYPMLVYFYEIMSNTHHQFSMPVYDDRPHISTYASDGYLVLQPDVVYEIGKPGSSAVDCVTSAVKKVIEMGYADPKHIGLQGHSWGGYQSSYILTRSDLFAAVVTGAPPTNLISFYDETYPGTGTLQQGIMEVGQVRMGAGVTPWTHHDLYEDQSPIFHVRDIKTPFMILHGTADNAVDWHQGLELYGAARRWGKKVILLSYPGEPHHLARKENQVDFQIRMKQFFDHYLKDGPEPKWMAEGLPQTRKGAPIQ